MFEPYLSVHEVYYDDEEKPYLWNPNKASPMDKEEAERIARAFDKEPIVEVDDASWVRTEEGYAEDYKTWKWL